MHRNDTLFLFALDNLGKPATTRSLCRVVGEMCPCTYAITEEILINVTKPVTSEVHNIGFFLHAADCIRSVGLNDFISIEFDMEPQITI